VGVECSGWSAGSLRMSRGTSCRWAGRVELNCGVEGGGIGVVVWIEWCDVCVRVVG